MNEIQYYYVGAQLKSYRSSVEKLRGRYTILILEEVIIGKE